MRGLGVEQTATLAVHLCFVPKNLPLKDSPDGVWGVSTFPSLSFSWVVVSYAHGQLFIIGDRHATSVAQRDWKTDTRFIVNRDIVVSN